jgi:hypothetical protein
MKNNATGTPLDRLRYRIWREEDRWHWQIKIDDEVVGSGSALTNNYVRDAAFQFCRNDLRCTALTEASNAQA